MVSGVTTDGGYAEVMIAEARGISSVPDELKSAEAAPLLCAGTTTAIHKAAVDVPLALDGDQISAAQAGVAKSVVASLSNALCSFLQEGLEQSGFEDSNGRTRGQRGYGNGLF